MEASGNALSAIAHSSPTAGQSELTTDARGFDALHVRSLSLTTGLANAMFRGREGVKRTDSEPGEDEWQVKPIIGLRQFGRLLRRIWLEARRGDPYAHWWLIRIEDAFDQAERQLQVSIRLYETRLANTCLKVKPTGREAREHKIRFINPLGNRGANLLGQFDRFLTVILECQQQGLISTLDVKLLQRAARGRVLTVFSSVFGYWAFGITDQDVAKGLARARQAESHMGELPEDVLTGDRRATCAPPPVEPSRSRAGAMAFKRYRRPPKRRTSIG